MFRFTYVESHGVGQRLEDKRLFFFFHIPDLISFCAKFSRILIDVA